MHTDRHECGEPDRKSSATGTRAAVAPIIALPAWLLLAAVAPAQPARVAYVIDGDTFRLATGERIRIAGIDAPETQPGQAKCRREIATGQVATARARAMLAGQTVRIVRVGRSYNRTVARVTLGGRDVAGELVRLSAARWWPRGERKPDWCRR